MFKNIPAATRSRLVAAARAAQMANPTIEYPDWYLQRWHFLPEGYLSRRSISGYDRVVRRLYDHGREAVTLRALGREIRAFRPARLVEFGCGTGRGLLAAARYSPSAEVTGVDLSPYMLQATRERLEQRSISAHLLHADVQAVPIPNASVDAVVAMHVLGHIPGSAAAAALTEGARILAPGGHLVVIDHSWHPRPESTDILSLVREGRLHRGLQRISVFVRGAID